MAHKYSEERNRWVMEEMQRRLDDLIRTANNLGVVRTIENVPGEELAMGNHHMVSSVRPARGNY